MTEPAQETYPLRLIAAQGGLGIELYQPLALGPILLEELAWSLPGVRFPVDLSGGVRSFANRRGEVTHARFGCDPAALSRWLHPRLRHLLGGSYEPPRVWFVDGGLGIGLWCRHGSVAFELLWAPERGDLTVVVNNARGAGFSGPALSQALAATDAILGKLGQRRGRIVTVEGVLEQCVRHALPELGVRAPSAREMVLGELSVVDNRASVRVGRDQAVELAPAVGRSLTLARLLLEADEALLSAEPDAARDAYLQALEAAPRHPEICQLVATLDGIHPDRTEAALGLLVESLPVTAFGLLGAELLLRTGDLAGAELAVAKQVQFEPYAPLGALAWTRLAELCDAPLAKLDYLDRALGISPRSHEARWARLQARLDTSDVNGALADAEHLEATARGSQERHRVLMKTAELVLARGFSGPAGRLFERALRYMPKASKAALGLAESLIATGRERRALPLLERAAQAEDEATRGRACLVFGRLLATTYQDLPQAIAQVQKVSSARPGDALEARALEARWRATLGDHAGANLAYARLHDLAQVTRDLDAARTARHLLEAADHAMRDDEDRHAAHRYASLALRLLPRDPEVQARYRALARELGPKAAPGGVLNSPSVPLAAEPASRPRDPEPSD